MQVLDSIGEQRLSKPSRQVRFLSSPVDFTLHRPLRVASHYVRELPIRET